MHIPTVTDEMLDKVVEAAASPVFIVFFEVGSADGARLRYRVETVADEFDDRVIFLFLNVDENPTSAIRHRGVVDLPTVLILKRGKLVGRAAGDVTRETLEELLERAITAEA